MDLRTAQFITGTRPKLFGVHITDVVINAVEKCWKSRDLRYWNFIIKERKKLFPWCPFGRNGTQTTNRNIEENKDDEYEYKNNNT